jgi:hypothetical protein
VSVLPDPVDLMAAADRIAGHATAARDRAGRVDAALAASPWRGFAADAFAEQAHLATGLLCSAAAGLDSAADALRRHAGRVSALVTDALRTGIDEADLMRDLVLHPGDVVSDAGDLVHDGLHAVGDVLHGLLP